MTFHTDLNSVKPACTASPCSSALPHSAPFLHSASSSSPPSSPIWPLSCLLAILANIGFGASIVVLNAYLLRLAVPPYPSRIMANREAFLRNCAHFLTWHRSRVHCWHLAATGHCAPCAARRGVYGCAAICHWWLWGMVGVVFHTRSSALAGREGI